MKVISLFSGIGAFESALTNMGVDYDLVNYCEIDKYASKSYAAIHNELEEKNLWDITKIDIEKLPKDEIDMITYGFPCQDISLSGKQRGMFNTDGTLTRSGLFFEALKVIEHCRPKIAIAENVKNLTSKKFAIQFATVLDSLEMAGYNNYWAILDAKDYGIPQHRERVFIVSIRKDIDTGLFVFPEAFESDIRLKDILEEEVDESYFLSEEKINKMGVKPYLEKVQTMDAQYSDEWGIETQLKTHSDIVKAAIADYNNNETKHQQDFLQHQDDICRCIPAGTHGSTPHLLKTVVCDEPLKIRKLTPRECFRLQGFSDKEYESVESLNSNTHLYKQAGNSIAVGVVEYLYKELRKAELL